MHFKWTIGSIAIVTAFALCLQVKPTWTCSIAPLELMIVWDYSASVGEKSFYLAKDVLRNITRRVNLNNDVKFFPFSNSAGQYMKTPMRGSADYKYFDSVISDVRLSESSVTNAQRLFAGLSNPVNRNPRDPNGVRVTLFVTDGQFPASLDIESEIRRYQNGRNYPIFVLATGKNINYGFLRRYVASKPEYLLEIADYRKIFKHVNKHTLDACDKNGFAFFPAT